MPKTKTEKQQTVRDLVENIKKAKAIVLADFKGLKVKEITALRRELKQKEIDCVVVKKTLMNLAFKESGIDFDAKKMPGHIIGVNCSQVDEVAPAKIMAAFAKTHEALKILGGFLESKFIEAGQVKMLAALPTKEELLAKMVGSIQAPLSGLVRVMAGNLRGLAQVLNAYKEKIA